jgi:hypothetical protein
MFTLEQKVEELYDRLVDETENPETVYSRKKRIQLQALLDVFEYLVNDADNPMDDLFGE